MNSKPMMRRKAPETIQEHIDEAIRLIGIANSVYSRDLGSDTKYMRWARQHVEAAELMQRLEDLHR